MGCNIIAHRGSNKRAPQNTLPAFRLAAEENADGFETDVHLTRDGIPVICHNYTVDDTSDHKGRISDYTLEELKRFDFGSYFSSDFAGTTLPTLDEFMETVISSKTHIINIELKSTEGGKYGDSGELVKKTLAAVKKYGVLSEVIISSFDTRILKAVKREEPACKTAFLYPTDRPAVHIPEFIPFLTAGRAKVDILHPIYFLTTRFLVKTAHKLGYAVNAWTVNDEKTVRRLLSYGVDGIITDCPGRVREFVNKYERECRKH